MIRRASVEEVERINDWVWRDSSGQPHLMRILAGRRPDFTQVIADRMNVALLCGEGGALFVWRGPGIFEVHVFFEQRGREVLALSREMLAIMRKEHGARLFWAAIPVESRHVIMFTRLMGWKSQGVRDVTLLGHCELFIGE